jgi:hypothetical protein
LTGGAGTPVPRFRFPVPGVPKRRAACVRGAPLPVGGAHRVGWRCTTMGGVPCRWWCSPCGVVVQRRGRGGEGERGGGRLALLGMGVASAMGAPSLV